MADGENNQRQCVITEEPDLGAHGTSPSNSAQMTAGERSGHGQVDDVGPAGFRPQVGIGGPIDGTDAQASGGGPVLCEVIRDGAQNTAAPRGASIVDRVVLPYGMRVGGTVYNGTVLAEARRRGDARIRIAINPANPTHVLAYVSGQWHMLHAVLSHDEARRPTCEAPPKLAPVQAAGVGAPNGWIEVLAGPSVSP